MSGKSSRCVSIPYLLSSVSLRCGPSEPKEPEVYFFPPVWDEEGRVTATTVAERETEESVVLHMRISDGRPVRLGYDAHKAYCAKGMLSLPGHVGYLDASRTWLSFWMSNALDLLGFPIESAPTPATPTVEHITAFVESCFVVNPDGSGGFAGGPNQLPHLAPTYSATLMLLVLGTPEALHVLETKREQLYKWFLTLKNPDGSVLMHEGGEIDVRGCYCMMLPAVLLGIDTHELRENMPEFIVSCQSYEGGFGCQPFEEAHGGYTFCATAALSLMRANDKVNLKSLASWLAKRQCSSQGGFNGRTNKLVDACYSFWVGASHAILKGWEAERRINAEDGSPKDVRDALLLDAISFYEFDKYTPGEEELEAKETVENDESDDWADEDHRGMLNCDQTALQKYLLRCCQSNAGGLRDKPSVGPDYYHTCYSLAGLSISQNLNKEHHLARLGEPTIFRGMKDFTDVSSAPPPHKAILIAALKNMDDSADPVLISEPSACATRLINPVFSVRRERALFALQYLRKSAVIPRK
eukprot:TRINITY_DN22409_c0_g1_i1.p1 TRINITY_DN22409_c0_g1~~TRINITY_DN22409_c0_g1_i1.p1  ORF type:complete len:527 (+),score=49.88 TRINITY_DN22409_c0_g1_i1:37-1617(+)